VKVSEREGPEEVDLADHQICRDLLHARCEMTVPEERHLLDERMLRPEHPVEPPHLRGSVACLGIEQEHRVRICVERGVRLSRVEQRIDGASRSERRERVDLRGRSAEAGAAEQMRGIPALERTAITLERGRNVQGPGRPVADLWVGGRIEFHNLITFGVPGVFVRKS